MSKNNREDQMGLDDLIQKLANALKRNIDLYDQMLIELETEREALKAHSLNDVRTCVEKKNYITHEIKMLENERIRILNSISGKSGLPPQELTLSKLAEKVGGKLKEQLLSIRKYLRESVEKVSEMNELNRGLIEKLININLGAAVKIQELIGPESTYKKGGVNQNPLKPGRVVSRKM